jgi:hypothetical protein
MFLSRTFAFLIFGVALCSASNITYNVNQPIGAGSVTGDIITDGMIGNLAESDILGYDVLINDGTDPPFDLISVPPLDVFVNGSDLSATATELLFNFSGADHGVFGLLHPSGDVGFCFVAGGPGGCFTILAPGPGEALGYLSPSFLFNTQFTSISGTQVIATAEGGGGSATPEPSSAALLIAGIVSLFGLRRFSSSGHAAHFDPDI